MGNQEQAGKAMGAWVREEFGGISLGEKRLEKRLVRVAERLLVRPQSPINQASETWAETKAAYRLFDNEKVEASEIFAVHQARTRHRLQAARLVLAIQDTTFLNFSTHRKAQGLGPIGDRQREQQGLIMHSTLAVQPDGGSLGLLTHDLWVRQGYGTKEQRKHRAIAKKESYKWLRALQQTGQAAAATPGRVVTVCDREADVYEFMAEAQRLHAEFVIRAAWNRGVAGRTRLSGSIWRSSPVVADSPLTFQAAGISRSARRQSKSALQQLPFGRPNAIGPAPQASCRPCACTPCLSRKWKPLLRPAPWSGCC